MKKSVRIHLLVITTVVAIFTFAGIWYLRPGVPNELIEQARARQLQPLLEIDAPLRRPTVESVTDTSLDTKALAQELLPTLTDQVSRQLEGTLYEKLKAQLLNDQDFSSQIATTVLKGVDVTSESIPEELQAEFANEIDALRSELLLVVGEGQGAFFYQIEEMLETRLDRFEEDLTSDVQAYVPQIVDRMIPSLVTMLLAEFDTNRETYLPLLTKELTAYALENIPQEQLLLLYSTYRDQLVMDLVPAILDAIEDPARAEITKMVKTVVPKVAVPPPPSPVTTRWVKSVPLPPEVVAKPIAVVGEPAPTVAIPTPPSAMTIRVERDEPAVPPLPEIKPVIAVPSLPEMKPATAVTPAVPPLPTMGPATSTVIKLKPIITPPSFSEDEPEVFIDPVTYEQKRTEIRTKAIEEVMQRIHSL